VEKTARHKRFIEDLGLNLSRDMDCNHELLLSNPISINRLPQHIAYSAAPMTTVGAWFNHLTDGHKSRQSNFSHNFRSFIRGSSVSTVSDYGLDDRGSILDRGRGFLF
jgi:hypothetical protein